ncbi:MAG: class I SAM-dependent methyltransferase [Chloroflexi bacterium]|nr:class I SAM-dependent methyltransferase [Chloroflexota bacterium]
MRQVIDRYGLIKRRRAIERYVRNGRLLEVGCGTGLFLDEMRSCGWNVSGVEPSLHASAYARESLGLNVFSGSLEQFDLSGRSFDVICMWDVLEHLPDPAKALVRLAASLDPGGLLVFSVPNLEGIERRLFKSYWAGWDLPRHLYLVPRRALADLLYQNGLTVVRQNAVAGSYQMLLVSVKWYLRDYCGVRPAVVQSVLRGLRSSPFQLAVAPLVYCLDALNMSSTTTYFAIRELRC